MLIGHKDFREEIFRVICGVFDRRLVVDGLIGFDLKKSLDSCDKGGVIRDVLLNNIPVIFHKEIYAVASVGGGLIYWGLFALGMSLPLTVIITFVAICIIRFIAVGYHISLPTLQDEDEKKE